MGCEIKINVLSGVSAGDVFTFPLDVDGSLVIGRSPDCDLVLQDGTVSRNHARVELRSDGFYLSDLGSTHGTTLMGFRLTPGDKIGRALSSGDELKIGESMFRVVFDDQQFNQPSHIETGDATSPTDAKDRTGGNASGGPVGGLARYLKQRPLVLLLLLVVTVMLLFAPIGGGKKKTKQKSHIAMNMPQERVIGYWFGGRRAKKKTNRDKSHLDKGQFFVPASDQLVEFDFRSEAPVEVYFDEILIERLEPNPHEWQHRQVILRDALMGQERRLIFDNTDYPRPKGKKSGRKKKWGVYNVRTTPLSRDSTNPGFDRALNQSLTLVEALDKTPAGLYNLQRSLQVAIIELLAELSRDGFGYGINLELSYPEPEELDSKIKAILDERSNGVSADDGERHLQALTKLVSRLDAELWRRVNNRIGVARRNAKIKKWIVAHDSLVAVKQMFPKEDDFRWVLADRLYRNKKVIPKRVRNKPARYRK